MKYTDEQIDLLIPALRIHSFRQFGQNADVIEQLRAERDEARAQRNQCAIDVKEYHAEVVEVRERLETAERELSEARAQLKAAQERIVELSKPLQRASTSSPFGAGS